MSAACKGLAERHLKILSARKNLYQIWPVLPDYHNSILYFHDLLLQVVFISPNFTFPPFGYEKRQDIAKSLSVCYN